VKSVGNDIVALNNIDKQRTCQPRFYSKFITPPEQALYSQTGTPFESFVLLLWSVKESAYKYRKRSEAGLVFSPSKIIIQQIEQTNNFENDNFDGTQLANILYKGNVSLGVAKLYFRSIIHNDYIATIVNDDEDFKNVYWGVRLIDKADNENQSTSVRSFVLNKLNSLFLDSELRIEKSSVGYPVLYNGTGLMDIPLSFAHHGNYVAYSLLIYK